MIVRKDLSDSTSAPTGRVRNRSQSTGNWGAWSNQNGPYVDWSQAEFASGIDIPNYYARKRRGELLPLTEYKWSSVVFDPAFYSGSSTDTTKTYNPFTEWDENNVRRGLFADPAVLFSDAQAAPADYLLQEAASRIYGSGWDGLTFAAELGQLRSMLLTFTRRVVSLMLKRLRRKGDWNLADLWLEARYGWRILYFDMLDIQKLLENADGERRRFRESAGFTQTDNVAEEHHSNWGTHTVTTVYNVTTEIGARGTIVADISPPKVQMNLLKTGWELVTFSFIIDWIVGIGRWIDAMSFLAMSRNHFAALGWYGLRETEIQSGPATSSSTSVTSTLVYNRGLGTCRTEVRLRKPSVMPLVPQITLNVDGLKVVDLIGLILQRLKR